MTMSGTRRRVQRARDTCSDLHDRWIDRRWLDVIGGSLVVGLHYLIVQKWESWDLLALASSGERRQAYAAAAILVSLIGAFSGVGIAQLASAKGAAVEEFKRLHAKELVSNWISIYRGALLAGLLAIVCLVTDVNGNSWGPSVAPWLFEFAVAFGVFKFARLGSLFRPIVLNNLQAEDDEVELADAVELDPSWSRRAG